MSDNAPEVTPEATADEQPKTYDADYVSNLRREAAKYRTEAKANADAAKRLSEIEEAQKSVEQKAAERLAEAERKIAEAEFKGSVAEIASKHGIPAALASGPAERTAQSVEDYVKSLLEWAGERRKQGNYVPNEGRTPTNSANPNLAFARNLFGNSGND